MEVIVLFLSSFFSGVLSQVGGFRTIKTGIPFGITIILNGLLMSKIARLILNQ